MKTLRLIVLASLASIFMAACTKNVGIEIPTDGINTITPATFEATTDAVKLSLSGLNPSWEAGDSLLVLQYGYWKIEGGVKISRDTTYNVFKTTGSTTFSGGIANFKLRVKTGDKTVDGCGNSFYAIYPASALKKYAAATTTSTLYVAPSQTGLLSEVGKHLTFKGSVSEVMDSTVRYENEQLTFLAPFTLKCCTPLIKFNVPSELGLTKIVITASNDTTEAVSLSGRYGSRLTNGTSNWVKPKMDTLSVYRGGSQISGDVYVVLAPETNLGGGNLVSDIKTIKFALTNAQGWTANIKLNLNELPKAGNLKLLPTFPTSVTWQKPVGPGLASMSCPTGNEAEDKVFPKKKILLTAENPSSTIKYSSCSCNGDTVALAAPATVYSDGIATDNGTVAFPANYSKIMVETENCLPYTCKAITWKLNSRVSFGQYFLANQPLSPEANVTTVPSGGSYMYGLSAKYINLGSDYKRPHIPADCFYIWRTSTKYCSVSISFVAPESGTATMYFNQTGITTSGKKLSITKGTTTVSEVVNPAAGDYMSSSFSVSAGDVITVAANSKCALYSMTFLWVPDTDN